MRCTENDNKIYCREEEGTVKESHGPQPGGIEVRTCF
jgi:hypothetical protein